MSYKIGEVVTDTYTNELLTITSIEHEGEQTYIRGKFVSKTLGEQTRNTKDIKPRT